jgi:hypothetical protein
MSLWARLLKALRAALFGWIGGWIAAIPFQVVEVIRASGPNTHLLASEAAFSLALWTSLTLSIALYFCGFFFLPVVWIVSEAWIQQHPVLWTSTYACFGALLMALRLHIWTALYHDGVSLINFCMWATYAAVFFLVASALYAKSLRPSPARALA